MRSHHRSWTRSPMLFGVVAVAVGLGTLLTLGSVTADESHGFARKPAQCHVEELPRPDNGVSTAANGVSPSGEYIVGTSASAPVEDNRGAVRWKDGEVQPLPIPGFAVAHAVNDSGMVVGDSVGETGTVPYVVVDDNASEIPGVRSGRATGVNGAGEVSGQRWDTDLEAEPFVWRPGAETVDTLPLPEGAQGGGAIDIDDQGRVAGWYVTREHRTLPYIWDGEGVGRELELPDIEPDDNDVRATTIAGDWAVLDANHAVLRWNLAAQSPAESLPLDKIGGANTAGDVVGGADDNALLWTGGETVRLPSIAGRAAVGADVSRDAHTVAGYLDHSEAGGFLAVAWRC